MKIKLSAVIITFNEEANLERCLTSLINVVDEIVVVDSFSSDNTKKVAQNFHVRFF
jgi:glycosyltransferase involved in cell wall biosynthesis